MAADRQRASGMREGGGAVRSASVVRSGRGSVVGLEGVEWLGCWLVKCEGLSPPYPPLKLVDVVILTTTSCFRGRPSRRLLLGLMWGR